MEWTEPLAGDGKDVASVRTIGEVILEAAESLEAAGIENTRAEASWLLAEVLGVSRAWLMAHSDSVVPPDRLSITHEYLSRRAAREPYAYVVGHREFYGLDLKVTPSVLIPRPETELLIEAALRGYDWLKAHKGSELLVADVGTGSGAIAIAFAVHRPGASVVAIDSSAEAISVAKFNAARHSVSGRIEFRHGNLLENVSERFDLLLANLPYVPTGDIPGLMPEVRNHEPLSALDGGPDGTNLVRLTLAQAAGRVTSPAHLLFEIGEGQGQPLAELAGRLHPRARVEIRKDYAGLERLLSIETG